MAQANAAKESLFIGPLLDKIGYNNDDLIPIRLIGDN